VFILRWSGFLLMQIQQLHDKLDFTNWNMT
jgi:hypothetical protein